MAHSCRLQEEKMFSIKKLEASKPKPYCNPLKVKVFGIGNTSTYTTVDGKEKKCVALGVAEKEDAIKVALYELEKLTLLKSGQCVVLTNYVYKADPVPTVALTAMSKVMKTSVFPVPGNIEVMAKAIANPATAKIMTIQDAKKSPVKSMVSIRGRVTSEEMVRTVQVRGNDVLQVRNVRINDGSEEIKLALWRDQVNGCNLVTSSYMEEVSLSTTQRTKIEPCEEPSSIVNGSVVAYEKTDGGYSLLIEENERFFTHSISLGILCAGLGSEEATVERTMSLLIPLDCEVQYTRGTVETFSCRSTLTTQQK